MVSENILIFGCGGHGKVVLDILKCSGRDVLGFIDDDPTRKGLVVGGKEVLGGSDYLDSHSHSNVALGIGDNMIRRSVYERLKDANHNVVTAIHPESTVAADVQIDEGTVIMPGAVVNTGTIIDAGVVINTGATVDHDCRLGKFSQVWPGANLAGSVHLGPCSYVGTAAAVIQNITIAGKVTIGAGAAVIRNLPYGAVAVGVPARVIRIEK